jgi:hypothetical protein
MPVSDPQLDTRGGEMPLLAIPADHPDFKTLSYEVLDMIENWKKNGKTTRTRLVKKLVAAP